MTGSSHAESGSSTHMEAPSGGYSPVEDPQQSGTTTSSGSLGLGSVLDTADAAEQGQLHIHSSGHRGWKRSISAPGSGGTSGWLEDLSSPLQDWASSLHRTISEGMAAIAEEFSGWSSGASQLEEAVTPKSNSSAGLGSPSSSPESARHRRSFSAQSPLPHPASCHDYFQPQELHVPDVAYEKKDK